MRVAITRHSILVVSILAVMQSSVVLAEDGASPNAEGSTGTEEENMTTPPKEPKVVDSDFNVKDHLDWGTYYDPQNIFCGKYDCYKILGLDYEEYDAKTKPDKQIITKRYRALSREWHPDKSKHKNAKERFVKIARAYEVLTSSKQRIEYDFMRYNQEAYFQKYGASVLWSYAPQSDATFIVLLLVVLFNVFSWVAQKQRWQQVASRLIQAATEEWSPSMGGTPESKHLREEAMELLKERDPESSAAANSTTTTTAAANGSGKTKTKVKGPKVPAKEKKRLEQEQLRPVITELVNNMHDFGAGFHKPTYRDLIVVKMAKWPYHITTGMLWQAKYLIRRWKGSELSEEERNVLTERAVGHVTWALATEEDQVAIVKRELWVKENLVAWKEQQEIKNLSRAEQKHIAKMKKKGIKDE